MKTFAEAQEVVHPVEKEWHYPIFLKYGFVPNTLTGKGMVRSYTWTHPTLGLRMRWSIGVNADYFTDLDTDVGGYWTELEPYLEKITSLTKSKE